MGEWLNGVAGPGYAAAVAWTFGALVLLLLVLLIVRLVRSLTFGTFVAGGRNRKTRLAVMDATAVDSHRRLVLVRRDDIEHLLLIGGPTDVVVERDIRLAGPRRPAVAEAPHAPGAHPQPAAAPRPAPRPQPASVAPPPVRPREPAPLPEPAPYRPPPAPAPYASANTATQRKAPPPPPNADDIDDALMEELSVSLDDAPKPAEPPAKGRSASLDDEMAKLLGELAPQKK